MGGLLTDFVEHHKNGEQIRGLPQINSARSLMIIMKKKYLLEVKYTSCHVSTWEEIQEMVKLKAILKSTTTLCFWIFLRQNRQADRHRPQLVAWN